MIILALETFIIGFIAGSCFDQRRYGGAMHWKPFYPLKGLGFGLFLLIVCPLWWVLPLTA